MKYKVILAGMNMVFTIIILAMVFNYTKGDVLQMLMKNPTDTAFLISGILNIVLIKSVADRNDRIGKSELEDKPEDTEDKPTKCDTCGKDI